MKLSNFILLTVAITVLLSLLPRNRDYPCNAAAPVALHVRTPAPPPIDALLTWVDTRDPVWNSIKHKYQARSKPGLVFDAIRLPESPWSHFEVMQCVPLLLKNLPFIRNLVVVMMRPQALPQELLNSLPSSVLTKIKYVYHDEFIPAAYLPTFNSSVIELFLHRIQALSEHFIYFNDDFYVVREMKPSHFFGYTGATGHPKYVPVVSCLEKTWAATVPPAASSWLMQRLKKTHAAAHCHSHRVYQSTRTHRSKQKCYIRDHRPIGLTKEVLHRTWDEVPQGVKHTAAQYRFRNSGDLLLLMLALHVALDTKEAIYRPAPALLFDDLSSTPLSEATVQAVIASNASFVCFNALDCDSEEQRRFLSDILYPQ